MDKHFFSKIYQENKLHIENYLSNIWDGYIVPSPNLLSAMKFSLEGPSKRIRGTLCLLVSQAITGITQYQNSESLSLSAILEIIHAYSLIHDDLPSMDDSPVRRGKPSCHIQFGEGVATLAGDALLTYAFEKLLNLKIPDQDILVVGRILAKVCGAQGMVGGQAMDIELQKEVFLPESTLQTIHEKKTGELIRASVVLPCYIHKKNHIADSLYKFGSLLGLMFQIKDDILDAESSSLEKEGPNYVSLLGIQKTQEKMEKIMKEAVFIVENLDIPQPEILIGFCEYMKNRKS